MFDRGLVVGKFAPLHKGHQYLIETALGQCHNLYVWTYANPDFDTMPTPVRMDWLRKLYPTAHLLPEPPASPHNDSADQVHQDYVKRILERWDIAVDVVFTSEKYGESFAKHIGANHVLVDLDRQRVPMSGTQMRGDIHGQRQWLDPSVYAHFVRKVVLLGGESTGKTTLAQRLAQEYSTGWVPEYGREVFEWTDGTLEPHHFIEIARGHRDCEERALRKPGMNRYLFCDTNAMTTAAFAFMMLGQAPNVVLRLADACKERYPYVFVCTHDEVPFTQDGWRSTEAARQVHHGLLLYELHLRGIPYVELRGGLEARVQQVKAVLGEP